MLNNTSSLGVRYWSCNRVILERLNHKITHNNQQFNVKSARRPDNSVTSKLEADHLSSIDANYQKQKELKHNIEQQAEAKYDEN